MWVYTQLTSYFNGHSEHISCHLHTLSKLALYSKSLTLLPRSSTYPTFFLSVSCPALTKRFNGATNQSTKSDLEYHSVSPSVTDQKYIDELRVALSKEPQTAVYAGWNIFAKISDGNVIPAECRHQYLELLRKEGRERDLQRIIFMVERIHPQNRTSLEDTYRITSLKNIGEGATALRFTYEFIRCRQLDDLDHGLVHSMIRWLVENNRVIEAVHLWEKTAARYLPNSIWKKFKSDGNLYLGLIFQNVQDPMTFLKQALALGGPGDPQNKTDSRRAWLEQFVLFLINHPEPFFDPLLLLDIYAYCHTVKWILRPRVTFKILSKVLADARPGLDNDQCIEIYNEIRKQRVYIPVNVEALSAMLRCAMFRNMSTLVQEIVYDFQKLEEYINVQFFNLAIAFHARQGESDAAAILFEELLARKLEPNTETFAGLMYSHDFSSNSVPVIRMAQRLRSDPTVFVQYLLDHVYVPSFDIDMAVRSVYNLVFLKVPVTLGHIEGILSIAAARGDLRAASYALYVAKGESQSLSIDAANNYLKSQVTGGRHRNAMTIFDRFEKQFGFERNKTTWLVKLRSLCALSDVDGFRSTMTEMVAAGHLADAQVYGILLELMGNTGQLETAQELFDRLSSETSLVHPDGNMYAVMMEAYFRIGDIDKVRTLYLQMSATKTPPTVIGLAILALSEARRMQPNLTIVEFPLWIRELFKSILSGSTPLDLTDPYTSFSTFPMLPSPSKEYPSLLQTWTSRVLFHKMLANIYRSPQLRSQPPVQLRTTTALLQAFIDVKDEVAIDLMYLYIRRRVKSLCRYPYQNEEFPVGAYICRGEKHLLSHALHVFLKSRSVGHLAPSSTKFPSRVPYRKLDYGTMNLTIRSLVTDDHTAFKAFWLTRCQLNSYNRKGLLKRPWPFPRLTFATKIALLKTYQRWKRGTSQPLSKFRLRWFYIINARHIKIRYPDVISYIEKFDEQRKAYRIKFRRQKYKPVITQ